MYTKTTIIVNIIHYIFSSLVVSTITFFSGSSLPYTLVIHPENRPLRRGLHRREHSQNIGRHAKKSRHFHGANTSGG